jgi:hypothetical protein
LDAPLQLIHAANKAHKASNVEQAWKQWNQRESRPNCDTPFGVSPSQHHIDEVKHRRYDEPGIQLNIPLEGIVTRKWITKIGRI